MQLLLSTLSQSHLQAQNGVHVLLFSWWILHLCHVFYHHRPVNSCKETYTHICLVLGFVVHPIIKTFLLQTFCPRAFSPFSVPLKGVITSPSHACETLQTTVHTLLCNQPSSSCIFFFLFFQGTSHWTNCDILMCWCSFVSQPHINPKLHGSAYCKQASLGGGGAAEGLPVVPSQRLVKDSTTFRSLSLFFLMSYRTLARGMIGLTLQQPQRLLLSSRGGRLLLEKATFVEEFFALFSNDHTGQCAIWKSKVSLVFEDLRRHVLRGNSCPGAVSEKSHPISCDFIFFSSPRCGPAHKHVPLIYVAAVKRLLRVVNIRVAVSCGRKAWSKGSTW